MEIRTFLSIDFARLAYETSQGSLFHVIYIVRAEMHSLLVLVHFRLIDPVWSGFSIYPRLTEELSTGQLQRWRQIGAYASLMWMYKGLWRRSLVMTSATLQCRCSSTRCGFTLRIRCLWVDQRDLAELQLAFRRKGWIDIVAIMSKKKSRRNFFTFIDACLKQFSTALFLLWESTIHPSKW